MSPRHSTIAFDVYIDEIIAERRQWQRERRRGEVHAALVAYAQRLRRMYGQPASKSR